MGYTIDRLRSFYEFNHGYVKLHTLPLIAEVELTNICNLKCGFCNRVDVAERGFGMMDYSYFIGLAGLLHKQMVHTRLFLHGESTLNPDLIRIVKFLNDTYRNYCGKKYVKSIGFATNGTLLDAEMFKQLMDAGLDNIEFSFEGTNKETYESLRSGAKFEVVKQNIQDACNINFESGNKVNIGINIIDCKQTHEGIKEFVKEWKYMPGLNRVDIGDLVDWAGTLNVDAYKVDNKESEYLPICSAPWFTCTIHWNGDVVPCCSWLGKPMGNVFHHEGLTFMDLWNGKGFTELRKTMLKGRQNHPYCKNCKRNLFSSGSPYLTKPNRGYPFTKIFLNQIQVYRRIARNKKYTPLKEKQK
jgi:radical SAM protein with 4Fe4S-binding SPASM domain